MADDAQRAKYAYHRGALDRGGGANSPVSSGVDAGELSAVDSMLFRGAGMGFDRSDVPAAAHIPHAGSMPTSMAASRVPARGHVPPQYVAAYNTSPQSRTSAAASRALGPSSQGRVGVLHGVSVGPQPAAYSPSGDIMAMINNVTTAPVPLHASSAAGVAQLSGRGGPVVPGSSSLGEIPSPYSGAVPSGGTGGLVSSSAGPYPQVTPSLQSLSKGTVQPSHLLPSRGNTFLMSSADFPALLGGPGAGRGRSSGKGRDSLPSASSSSPPIASPSSTPASFRAGDSFGQRRVDHANLPGDRAGSSDSVGGGMVGSGDSRGPGYHERDVHVDSGVVPTAPSIRAVPVHQSTVPVQQNSMAATAARLRRSGGGGGGVSDDQHTGMDSSSSQVGAARLRSDVDSSPLSGAVVGEDARGQQVGSVPVVSGRHSDTSRGGSSGRSDAFWQAGATGAAVERGSGLGIVGLGPSQAGKYGMEGLLRVIQMKDVDLNTLALGTDLTSLGLNLNSPDTLHTTFASPWADAPYPRDVPFTLPSCYRLPNPIPDALAKVAYFSDDTLFYIFYALLQSDPLHAAAIRELYDRGWTLHRDTGAWMQMPPGSQQQSATDSGAAERGVLQRLRVQMLDVNAWERVSRDIAVPPVESTIR